MTLSGRRLQGCCSKAGQLHSTFLIVLLPFVSLAQFTYVTNNGAITITSYDGPGGAVSIPATIEGLPVVAIGGYAFDTRGSLTSITIPDSVTSIGTYAFQFCSSLTSVAMGNGVQSIGFGAFFECRGLTSVTLPNNLNDFQTYAFRGCSSLASLTIPTNVTSIANSAFFDTGLTNINIPRSVTSIGSSAFHPCPKLQAITVDALNPSYTSVDGALLNKSRTLLIQCPGGKTGSYAVPDSVTSIGASAVSYCGELTTITLGSNVTTIADQAFFTCPKLTGMIITERVTSLGSSVFAYCSGLTNVALGKGLVNIGNRAFASCTKLTAFYVDILNPAFATADGVLFTKNLATLVCYPGGKAGAYSIPNGVTNILGNAFESSVNLTKVVIPKSVTQLPGYAFASCSSLTSVTIPATMILLGDRAFVACGNLTAVYFCGNAPALGSSFVFYNANLATLYYLPGMKGWGSTLGGRPCILWNPSLQTDQADFGVQPSGFHLPVTGTPYIPIVIEATTNLSGSGWTLLHSCTLTNGAIQYIDTQWTDYPNRFYRIRSP